MLDRIELLERLAEMRKAGALTEAEFATQKAEVLAGPRELAQPYHGPDTEAEDHYYPEDDPKERPSHAKTLLKFWPVLGILLGGYVTYESGLLRGSDNDASVSNATISPFSKKAVRVEDPGFQIAMQMLENLEQARKDWVGRQIEFKFWPASYERSGEKYLFTGTDTPIVCAVDKTSYEKIVLRQPTSTSRNVIVRGTVGSLDLDAPVTIENCELVTVDDRGWTPELLMKRSAEDSDAPDGDAPEIIRAESPSPEYDRTVPTIYASPPSSVSPESIPEPAPPAVRKTTLVNKSPATVECAKTDWGDASVEVC